MIRETFSEAKILNEPKRIEKLIIEKEKKQTRKRRSLNKNLEEQMPGNLQKKQKVLN